MGTDAIRRIRERAAEIVERGWCQGANAVDDRGDTTDSGDRHACRFCFSGAIYRAAHEIDQESAKEMDIAVMREIGREQFGIDDKTAGAFDARRAVVTWNDADGRTAAEVIAALRSTPACGDG